MKRMGLMDNMCGTKCITGESIIRSSYIYSQIGETKLRRLHSCMLVVWLIATGNTMPSLFSLVQSRERESSFTMTHDCGSKFRVFQKSYPAQTLEICTNRVVGSDSSSERNVDHKPSSRFCSKRHPPHKLISSCCLQCGICGFHAFYPTG